MPVPSRAAQSRSIRSGPAIRVWRGKPLRPERLYSEIGKLKMELDWLKKKSGINLP